jgi:hypothetical protein
MYLSKIIYTMKNISSLIPYKTQSYSLIPYKTQSYPLIPYKIKNEKIDININIKNRMKIITISVFSTCICYKTIEYYIIYDQIKVIQS